MPDIALVINEINPAWDVRFQMLNRRIEVQLWMVHWNNHLFFDIPF